MTDTKSHKAMAMSALNKALGELKSDDTPLSRELTASCILDAASHVANIAELKRARTTKPAATKKIIDGKMHGNLTVPINRGEEP